MLKEEPKLLRYYSCIKNNNNHYIDDWLVIDNNTIILDIEYWKPIFNYRRAFVGDMQQKLDKVMQCNNMEIFAKTCGNKNREFVYAKVSSIKKDNWFKKLWKNIYNKIKPKDKECSMEEFLYKDKDSTIIYPDGYLISLDDFLSTTNENEIERLRGQGFFNKK